MKIIKAKNYNSGSREISNKEPVLPNLNFKVHKFNNRPKPTDKGRIVLFTQFGEFGSELISSLYCIPKLLQTKHIGKYSIVVGWANREYLYKYLVDEYWELGEDYQFLREWCRAFHHESKNLKKVEKELTNFGCVSDANEIGVVALTEIYPKLDTIKESAHFPPMPSQNALDAVKDYILPNMVGITARNRKCYGRNLQLSFYEKLIDLLQSMNYNIVWMGEKATTYDCPRENILNFRNSEHAKDLEKALAVVSKCKFTIQFYTASSRLAGLTGTPFILCESPDQIWQVGQEGIRLNLCSRGPKKLIISHFRNIFEDNACGLALVKDAVAELENSNFDDIIGAVENPGAIYGVRKDNYIRIGSGK